jgi:hypothetical protein
MNYLVIYNNLIQSRKVLERKKGHGEYYESHHIVPKWLGGGDKIDNRVLLTAREHFLAHWCLWRHYRDRPSALAFHKMIKSSNSKQERNFSSREFELARKAFAESQTGEKNHMYGKVSPNRGKTSPNKGKKLDSRPHLSGDNNPAKRNDVRKSISVSLSGVPKSKEHIDKIQAIFFAAPKIRCEHCQKEVDYRNFGRWHGDNCKLAKILE